MGADENALEGAVILVGTVMLALLNSALNAMVRMTFFHGFSTSFFGFLFILSEVKRFMRGENCFLKT